MQLLAFFDDVKRGTYAAVNLSPSPKIGLNYGAEDFQCESPHGTMQRVYLKPEILIESLDEDPDFRAAARNAVSNCFGRGPSIIGRFHCWPLADAIYASITRSTGAESGDSDAGFGSVAHGTTLARVEPSTWTWRTWPR